MDEPRRTSRRIRRELRSPGLSVNLAADVHVVSSTTSERTSSATQHVHVRQGRSARTAPPPDQKEQS